MCPQINYKQMLKKGQPIGLPQDWEGRCTLLGKDTLLNQKSAFIDFLPDGLPAYLRIRAASVSPSNSKMPYSRSPLNAYARFSGYPEKKRVLGRGISMAIIVSSHF